MVKILWKDTALNDDCSEFIQSNSISDEDFYILRLYVAGQTRKSLTAFANLKQICEEHLVADTELRL